jgi:hypothetical protein
MSTLFLSKSVLPIQWVEVEKDKWIATNADWTKTYSIETNNEDSEIDLLRHKIEQIKKIVEGA